MPRYYFHLYNDIVVKDEEGKSFPDLATARANAIREAREIMTETVAQGRINFSDRVDIADQAGTFAASVTFGEAVRIVG